MQLLLACPARVSTWLRLALQCPACIPLVTTIMHVCKLNLEKILGPANGGILLLHVYM